MTDKTDVILRIFHSGRHNFVLKTFLKPFKSLIIMVKKLIPTLLAFSAVFCTMPMHADSMPEDYFEIPIKTENNSSLVRSVPEIQAYYLETFCALQTVIRTDLGEVNLTVKNLSTSEVLWSTFDSQENPQFFLPISGAPGYYEIEFITESGDVYVGEFIID